MAYRVEAILVVLLAVSGYVAATWMFLRKRPGGSLLLLLGAAFLLRCFSGGADYLHPWDERYHALVAKHLVEHPLVPTLYDPAILPYRAWDWERNHVWLHKPPLALWLIALSIKVFGATPFAVRIPSIVLSTLGIALTWEIGRRLFDGRIAFLAALFHALSGILMAQSAGWFSTDHTDTIFIFFIELGVYFCVLLRQKFRWEWALLAGASVGLALLTKWAAAMVVFPVFVGLMWHRRPVWKSVAAGAVMLAVAIVVAAPWQIYIRHAFPNEYRIESSYNWKHLTVPLEDHNGPWYYHFGKAYEFYGVMVYPAMLLAFWLFFRNRLPRGAGAMLLWFSITYFVFTLAATKMGGYVLIAAPAVFLLMALVLAYLQDQADREGMRGWSAAWFLLFTIMAGIPILQRLNLFNRVPRSPAWATALHQVEKQLPAEGSRLVVFHDPHPIETMFDTDVIAYSKLPTPQEVAWLKNQKKDVIVLAARGESVEVPAADNVRVMEAPAALWEQ
ncbi:MAG: ArnT family glycosyltransferase [Phycisphaerae bacterium]